MFTSQNLITIDAVRALHDLGLAHSIALVGFDGPSRQIVLKPALVARGSGELPAPDLAP